VRHLFASLADTDGMNVGSKDVLVSGFLGPYVEPVSFVPTEKGPAFAPPIADLAPGTLHDRLNLVERHRRRLIL
jgi:hypothetical protein